MRQGQLLLFDVPLGESCSRVALANARMALPPYLSQNLCADDAMLDIGCLSETLNTRGIALVDADVVEHGSLLQKLRIKLQFRMGLRNLQAAIGHLATVN